MERKITIVLMVAFLLLSCGKEENKIISFSQDIAPFLEITCTACHYGGRQEPNLHENVSYNQLTEGGYVTPGKANQSAIVIQLENGHPENIDIPSSQIKILKEWINQGATNN
ncbi:hypothetical protein [Maribellus maritimus]|uniref:hypothetical protein n=1 Tax=Maribellus maritimus TaxID=2870838 RepID=UPI001EEC6D2A|nr:hypothetical protein [Maribellus maritimus]MCG6186278.1 hypothetical protein [Maribellus maritimus]